MGPHLALDDLCLLLDPHTNGFPECLHTIQAHSALSGLVVRERLAVLQAGIPWDL